MVNVELVYAEGEKQIILEFFLPEGSTVQDVIAKAQIHLNERKVGIFSKIVSLDYILKSGDRVEIYSPLLNDPKVKRKQKAKK